MTLDIKNNNLSVNDTYIKEIIHILILPIFKEKLTRNHQRKLLDQV